MGEGNGKMAEGRGAGRGWMMDDGARLSVIFLAHFSAPIFLPFF
jgi:hypothetical protein